MNYYNSLNVLQKSPSDNFRTVQYCQARGNNDHLKISISGFCRQL